MRRLIGLFLVFIQIFVPSYSLAAEFNPHYIMSDFEMTDYQSLGLFGTEKFLQKSGSFLASYIVEDVDGGKRMAAEIIFLAAHKYKINPKVILVMLQKEQSLVEENNPSQYQLDWAAGYGRCDDLSVCGPGSEVVQKYRGFAKQIDYAAGALRFFLENPDKASFQVGRTAAIDGQLVTPVNSATVNLYTYTPHIHGNYNFWKIWNRWFGQDYPDGSLLQDRDSGDVWLIQDGLRRKVAKSVFITRYDPKKVIQVGQETLESYEIGRPIKFLQYSLLQNEKGGIYLLVNDKIRPIVSEKVFKTIGFNLDEVIRLKDEQIKEFSEGEAITLSTVYPTGALLQNKSTGGIYYVENGVRHPIWSRELLKTNFSNRKTIIKVAPDRLDQISEGDAIKFNDGELVKSDTGPTVYVISNGKKWPIGSGEAFERLGYKWENVITTNDKVLSLHHDGQVIN